MIFKPLNDLNVEQISSLKNLVSCSFKYHQGVVKAWSSEQILTEISQNAGVVALSEGTPLSFILFRVLPGDILEVTWLATQRSALRQGLMQKLFKFLRESYPQSTIWLEVNAANSPAIELYTLLGFKEAGHRPNYYSQGENAILMTLEH